MKLRDYLHVNRIKRKDFAAKIGVSPAAITLLCESDTWPRRKMIERIAAVTDGQVTANDFMKLEEPS
jgi:3,4-dihydroxy 2-butanone 4-phosphate synthase/GTP cyclohydrolase II